MTDINTILDTDWDTDICTKPDIIDDAKVCRRFYYRVVSTRIVTTDDEIEGIFDRTYYTPESYDGYICWIIDSSEAKVRLMIAAIKKICARYTPVTGEENILEWKGGEWHVWNQIRYEHKFVLLKKKSGIPAF